ncbi:MAG: hypothetical protein OQJ84_04235 [Xanthomonadales bacterium]|nr:hypothetical protein [Xanthomonadales bacterium]
MNHKQAKRLILLAAVFTGGLVFYFLPSEIYAGNPLEFHAVATDIVTRLVLGGLLLALALALPIMVPLLAWRKLYAVLLGGTFLALWVSGVFLVGDFGELDGSSFDMARHSGTLMVHGLVFLAVLCAAWLATWKWPGIATTAVAFIGTGLLVIATFNFYRAGAVSDPQLQPIDPNELARFSSEKNLLIVLMDSFQSDVLRELIKEQPALADDLDGFGFYPDTLGVAPTTYLTMPAFHSGRSYNNTMALSEYYDVGVKTGSFMVELAEGGYQVDLLNPITRTCPRGSNICEQQENLLLHAAEIVGDEAARLADLSLMRVAPGYLKQWVYNDNNGPFSRRRDQRELGWTGTRVYHGNTILQMIADKLQTNAAVPTAKLIHLFNSHPPYIFDGECNFIGAGNPQDRPHMTMQIKCGMHWFVYLLQRMKAAGIYDNSMIILTADTGAGIFHAKDSLSSLYAQEHGVPPGKFGRLIGGANPVLAIKFPRSHGTLQTSSVSAQTSDIPRTVCETLGDCTNTRGVNLRNSPLRERSRPYNYYRWKNEYWSLNHIPGMLHYTVTGPLWLESSWSQTAVGEMPELIATVNFSREDDPAIYGPGWSHYEVNNEGVTKRWSDAKRAELYLPLPSGEDLTLEFKVLMAPGLPDQEMTVKVNGQVVGSRDLEHRIRFVSVGVPSSLISQPVTEVALEFSRLKMREGRQRRDISVSFYQLNIYQ